MRACVVLGLTLARAIELPKPASYTSGDIDSTFGATAGATILSMTELQGYMIGPLD